jgi:hypothetical protein
MAVIIMQLTALSHQIFADFPKYTFIKGDDFHWSASQAAIFYPHLSSPEDIWSLLHEIGHGELGHQTYGLDIELVGLEVDAWDYAIKQLAPNYGLIVDEDYLQDHLDTYRQWLHARSTCPECGQNGLQTKNTYSCINCRCLWRANEALMCNLRRIKLQVQNQTF